MEYDNTCDCRGDANDTVQRTVKCALFYNKREFLYNYIISMQVWSIRTRLICNAFISIWLVLVYDYIDSSL